jgi:hypothetical protein
MMLMRKFRFIGTKDQAEDYDDDDLPVAGRVYLEGDEVGGVTVEEWATESTPTIRKEWEEVFEDSNLQTTPDLFEAYLEGVIDVYEASDTDTQSMGMLKRILGKYRVLKSR